MDTEDIRALGRVIGRVESLEARFDRMEPKIDTMFQVITEAKGGWKTLVAVGTVAAGVGAIAGKAIAWVFSAH